MEGYGIGNDERSEWHRPERFRKATLREYVSPERLRRAHVFRTTFGRLRPTLVQLPGQLVDWMFDCCACWQPQKHQPRKQKREFNIIINSESSSTSRVIIYVHIHPCSGTRRAPEGSSPLNCRRVRRLKSLYPYPRPDPSPDPYPAP